MTRRICLLAALLALAAAPPAAGMPLRRGQAYTPTASAADAVAAPRGHTPRHRFILVDASAGAVVRARPRGAVVGTLPAATPLGTPTWLWAVATSRDGRWARVVLPWRRNGRTGWITLRGTPVVHTRTWVQADLSRRRLSLMHGSRTVASFVAAVGAAASPTPIGRFSVTDPIATGDPTGPFGWYAFGLSGHQPHLPPGWSGGDQLAIHGTNDPASLGTATSAGCLRVSATALAILKRALRPGTPVVIHP
jgi:lipoprotein-anchoring transpeptidase ErfK/SrfK